MDVKTAFLNGELKKEIYMEQPEGYAQHEGEDYVLKLNKAVGLKQAPNVWNEDIGSIDFTRSTYESCCYVMNKKGKATYVALCVDDKLRTSGSA